MKNPSENKNNLGFTLIELLVVVAIISILASVVMTSVSSARSKARNAQRKSDLHQIQLALELYYDKYGGYPTGAWSDAIPAVGYTVFTSIGAQANFTQFLKAGSMGDPLSPTNISCYNQNYTYFSTSFRSPNTLGTKYVLYASLEGNVTSNLNPVLGNLDYQMTAPGVWVMAPPCDAYPAVNYRVGEYNN